MINDNDIDSDVVVVDKDISTTTPTNNLDEILHLGEFKNVVITRGQYNKQLSYTKSDAPKYNVDINDNEVLPFVNAYIQELSENIAEGKEEEYNPEKPRMHASILHRYRHQKLKCCNKSSYIQKFGHPLKEIKNHKQEIVFLTSENAHTSTLK